MRQSFIPEIALEISLRDLLAVTQWVKIICNDCYAHYHYLTSQGKEQKTGVWRKMKVDLSLQGVLSFAMEVKRKP